MYSASQAFHDAVRNGSEQKALLIFRDCVFTDDDICLDRGIEFHDYFNVEENIAVGQTLSNEISFSLFNDGRLLNNYEFGDFLATIGALVGTDTYQQMTNVYVVTSYAAYTGSNTYPYVRRNGVQLSVQPGFAIRSIAAYNGDVWCFGANNRYFVYRDSDGANITSQRTLNSFMKAKAAGWTGKGIFYNKDSRMLMIYQNGKRKRYEFVPLGHFTAERPNAPDVLQIDMNCYDFMQKFEEDMPDNATLNISFPCTIRTLYEKMCIYAGVQYSAEPFINQNAVISARPDDFDNATMRDVLKWIAEAAGSNARFNRDGVLVMDWLRQTSQTFNEGAYVDFNPYWYETKKVTKLLNRSNQGESERVYGTGDEAYLIQDNPLLRGVN